MRNILSSTALSLLVAASFAISGSALAAGSHSGGHGQGHGDAMSFGAPARAADADRTIEIEMGDSYFRPELLSIRSGETIRFVVRNSGELLHEFNLGTAAMHAAHREEMMTMMEEGALTATGIDSSMMGGGHGSSHGSGHGHDDPNSVLVGPGETRELVWRFSKLTDLEFACNVPGHYEAGMKGKIDFTKPYKADS